MQPLPLGAIFPRSLLLRCHETVATVRKESLKGALFSASTSRCHLIVVTGGGAEIAACFEKKREEKMGIGLVGGCLRPSWRPTSVRACRVHLPQVNPRPGHDQQYWKPTKSPASSDYSSPWPSPSLSTVNQTNSRQGEPIWLVRFNLDKSSIIYFSDFLASDLCETRYPAVFMHSSLEAFKERAMFGVKELK